MSFSIVLVEPEIPANTGSIGRTCVATQTPLHLVGKLGFSLEDRYLKRAGLDYWKDVRLMHHASWENFVSFSQNEQPRSRLLLFSKKAKTSYLDFSFQPGDILIFGKETKGLSDSLLDSGHPLLRIPTPGPVRSLNLASAAAVVLYEALRQTKGI